MMGRKFTPEREAFFKGRIEYFRAQEISDNDIVKELGIARNTLLRLAGNRGGKHARKKKA